jgi:YVTN family beta-propeller protein
MDHLRQSRRRGRSVVRATGACLSTILLAACAASAPATSSAPASIQASAPPSVRASVAASIRPSAAPSPTTANLVTPKQIAEIETGARPVWMAASPGAIWVANTDDSSVSRIDPATNTVVATIPVEAGKVVGFAADDAFVFAIGVDRMMLDRIDIATNAVGTFPIESAYGGLAFGGGWLWHAASGGEVLRIDPKTGKVDASVKVGGEGPPASIAADDGGAWVASGTELVRVTNGSPPAVERRWDVALESQISLDGGRVWAVGPAGTAVGVAIDTGEATEPIKLEVLPYMSAAEGGSLWLRGMDLDLHRADPATGASVAVYPITGQDYPGGFIVDGDEAWIANLDRGTVSRIGLAP